MLGKQANLHRTDWIQSLYRYLLIYKHIVMKTPQINDVVPQLYSARHL